MDPDGISAPVDAIRRYLVSHPNASDTVEGVRRWWLSAERLEASYEAVAVALERLVAEGAVGKRRLRDGTIVYSARPESTPREP
jgi:hypothetical protein